MNILGINYFFHDTSACLLSDGRLVAAMEEERLSRNKHTTEFPWRSIDRCLELGGIDLRDVDHVAFSVKPSLGWRKKVCYAIGHPRRALEFARYELSRMGKRQRGLLQWLAGWPKGKRPRLHFVEHHLSHAAGSFYVSPYDDAALLCIDGSGEWATSLLGHGQGNRVETFHQSHFPMSLGSFYEGVTEHCGFRPNYDEGKTMGLAPYGDPRRYRGTVSDIARVDVDGGIGIDLSYFAYQFHGWTRCAPKFREVFGAPRDKVEDFADRHRDAAAAFQEVLEERALSLARLLRERTGARHLVLSGGVALNSVMNGRILRESGFEDVYVMPGAGDNGTSIGAAAYVQRAILGDERRPLHDDPYIGTAYNDRAIRAALDAHGVKAERRDDIEALTARLLDAGKIVGWFQGRMEFGPRSLGNRSILANPTLPHMKATLNDRVKHREAFRPFAPSALAERAHELFDIAVSAPFMLKVCDVRPSQRVRLPAITHVDGTARLQTVHRETNPRYHAMIQEFDKLAGVPVVLNTSFNVMGQPIVETPADAIACYLGTGIDALVIGDYVASKEDPHAPVHAERM
jgi:carbamoyltransferase